jgi:hypothetical protein
MSGNKRFSHDLFVVSWKSFSARKARQARFQILSYISSSLRRIGAGGCPERM